MIKNLINRRFGVLGIALLLILGVVNSSLALSTAGSLSTSITVQADLTPAVIAISPNTSFNTNTTAATITGINFTGATSVVLGATSLIFAVVNDGRISATIPAGFTPGIYNVQVTTPNGTSAVNPNATFTVLSNTPPAVTNLNPSQAVNTTPQTVIVTGTNFAGANQVKLGVSSLTFVTNSNTQITATIPAAVSPGIFDITVTTPGGTSATNASSKYTVLAGAPPSITTVSPGTGPNNQGTPVTIGGSGFTGVTSGAIGTTALTNVVVVNDNQVTASVPAGITPGTYNVAVTGPGGTSPSGPSSQFTVTAGAPAPSITAMNPNNGPNTSTTAITITGTGFTGVTSGAIGATPLQNVTVVSPTQVTATVPSGLTPATYNVSLTSPNGTSTNTPQSQFTVTSGSGGTPGVTSVTPSTGPNNQTTPIAIGGANLGTPTAVRIGNIALTSTGISATQVNATVPSGIVPGTYDITVTTAAGTSPTGPGSKFTVTSGGGGGGDTQAPTSPDGVTVSKTGNNLTLGWVASTDNVGVTQYNIYRSTEANFAPTAANRIGTSATTQFTDSNVLADTSSYFYRVTAQDAAGNESVVSNMGFKRRLPITFHTNISNINWLSIPYRSPFTTANDIAQDIPNVTKVSRFNPDTQTFEHWENFFGSFSGSNFAVRPGESYAVVINANSTANLVGWHDAAVTIAMTHHDNISNINNISIPYHARVTVANDVVNQVGPNISKVGRFNPNTQQTENWEEFFGSFSGVNFTVTPGEGHVLIIKANTQWKPDTF